MWTALSAGVLICLFALGLALGERLLLAPLLGCAALVAAIGTSPRVTGAVAVTAFAAALLALLIQTGLDRAQDGVRLLDVALTGALAAWIAHLRHRLLGQTARREFLARVTERLMTPADHRETLRAVAELAVPGFADRCTIDLAAGDGGAERVASARADGAGLSSASGTADDPPAAPDDTAEVLRTGRADVVLDVRDDGRDAAGGDPPAAPRETSVMRLPMVSRSRTLGAIAFGRAGSRRRFSRGDLEAGTEVARRCALVVDNGRLLDEMRDTQRRLLEAFGLLDVLFERAPIGLAFFDRDSRYLRLNDRLAEMNGVPASEHLGRRTSEVLPGMDASVAESLRQVLEQGVPQTDVELRGVTPADPGRERDFVVSYFPVRRGGVEVIGVGTVVLDVTDRKAAERALRAQTDRYETLLLALSEVGEGMVVLEGEHVVYANQAFQTMTGYGYDELRAMESVFELVVPEARDEARARADVRRKRELVDPHYELAVRHRAGTVLDLEVAGVPLEIEGAQQLVIVVRDVTARRRAEGERERLLAAERDARAEAEAAHERSRFLAEASAAFDQSLDVQRTTELAAALAIKDAPSSAMVVLTPAGDPARLAAATSRDPRTEAVLRTTLQQYPLQERATEHPVMEAARTGRAVVVRDFSRTGLAVDDQHESMLREIGSSAMIAMPLRARDRTLGAIALGYDEPLDGPEVAAQQRLFEDFAARAALALDNARLYEERSHIARTLQRSLLPTELPRIPGTELAARYLAAGEGNEVGGDFYDGFALGGNEWALVIGDVCGKGAEAAAITALARYTARAAVLHSRRPSRVLGELNEALLRQQIDYRFCTVAFAALQPLSSGAFAVRMAAGGHPLPLVLRADGTSEYAGSPGTLLGIVDRPQLPEREFVLEPGDALVLYTDGVIEASPVDDVLGPEAFAEYVTTLHGADAATIAARIEQTVLGVQDGGLRDDVALLVLRVVPE